MKKLLFIAVVITASYSFSTAQAQKVLNLGGLGTGLYGGIEFPVGKAITVGPLVNTDWDFDKFVIAAKANYYFDNLFGLTEAWDVYGGGNVGWRIDNGSDDGANWGLQVGGRWFWSDKWGINAEFGGGSGVTGGIGITMKL